MKLNNIKSRLRRCPFCDGEAEFVNHHDITTDIYKSYIRCSSCGNRTEDYNTTATRFNPPNYQTIDDIINDMVKRWNSRVN